MDYHEQILRVGPGVKTFMRRAEIPGEVVAEVVLTHGRGEHSGRYGHVAKELAERGLRLWSYDLRGHGRSSGSRGDISGYGDFLDDLGAVVAEARKSGLPLFLLGHSLGGQITLNYLLAHPDDCVGAIVASPYLRLAFVPKRWRLLLAALTRWIWPGFIQKTVLPLSRLSRDQVHLASLPEFELMHHRISARFFFAIHRGAARALAGAAQIHTPLLLIHGGADQVTSVEATREFFGKVGAADKTLSVYPEMLHETHNEIGRERVLAEMLAWIDTRARMDGGRAAAAANSSEG